MITNTVHVQVHGHFVLISIFKSMRYGKLTAITPLPPTVSHLWNTFFSLFLSLSHSLHLTLSLSHQQTLTIQKNISSLRQNREQEKGFIQYRSSCSILKPNGKKSFLLKRSRLWISFEKIGCFTTISGWSIKQTTIACLCLSVSHSPQLGERTYELEFCCS